MTTSDQTGDEERIGISEAAADTGLSVDTLRYYERIGLIRDVPRNPAGHRRYGPDHVAWLRALDRLRSTGMTIQRLKTYADLAAEGTGTLRARRRLLDTQRRDLERRMRDLTRCLGRLDEKIERHERLARGDASAAVPCLTAVPDPTSRSARPTVESNRRK